MRTIVLSSWEQAVAARKMMGGIGAALFLAASALGLAGLFGFDNVRWPAVVVTLLATHAMTGWFAWSRIAQLQAALDMKQMALATPNEGTMRMSAGQRLQINGSVTLEVDRYCNLKVVK